MVSTGIATKNDQHICGFLGEYGDDSNFPGFQSMSMVDDKGNSLLGSPSLVPFPNQGTSNFTGSTTGSTADRLGDESLHDHRCDLQWNNWICDLSRIDQSRLCFLGPSSLSAALSQVRRRQTSSIRLTLRLPGQVARKSLANR